MKIEKERIKNERKEEETKKKIRKYNDIYIKKI